MGTPQWVRVAMVREAGAGSAKRGDGSRRPWGGSARERVNNMYQGNSGT
ncbi:hypothetical protein MTP06_01500 [Streptomyces sp. PLM4]|nr:hypothetical protein MTP06_01500 [Streptomyces sp. PLM4]